MKTYLLLFAYLVLNVRQVAASELVIISKPLDHSGLITANFDSLEYATYQRNFEDTVRSFFSQFNTKLELKIIQTFDQNLDPYFTFSSKPILTDSLRSALEKKLTQLTPINARYLSFSNQYSLVLNGGITARDMLFLPELSDPRQLRQNDYAFLDIKKNYEAVQSWIRTSALPLLIELMSSHPERLYSNTNVPFDFSGDAKQTALELITNANFDLFYRSSLPNFEDNPQLLIAIKTMRLAAKGQFDYAQLYIAMVYNFESRNSLVRYILDELSWRLAYYFRLEGLLLAAAESQTNPNEKHALIDSILTVNPLSTGALYATIDPTRNHLTSSYPYLSQWQAYSTSNPMYIFTRQSASKKEAYQNYLRITSYDLFMDPETYANAHAHYASLALEIEEYDFAADLYWMLSRAIGKKNDSEYAMGVAESSESDEKATKTLYEMRYAYALNAMGYRTEADKKTKKSYTSLHKSFQKKMKQHASYKEFKYE